MPMVTEEDQICVERALYGGRWGTARVHDRPQTRSMASFVATSHGGVAGGRIGG